jgi:hypothetical protein
MEGRWHDAQAILEEALTFATEHQYTHLWESFMVRAWLLRTCHYLGDHTRAAELADDMRTEAGQGDIVRFGQAAWVSACRLLQQGSFEEADALIERWRPRVPSEPNHQRVLLEVAQLHSDLDQGRLEGVAQRVLSSTQELAEAGCLYSPWHEFLYYIPALEVVAALESGSGRVDKRSKSALLKMVKQVQRQGAPFMSCMAHRAQALLAHAEGKTREARTQTLKALALSATANTPYHRYLCLDTATMLGIGGEELSEEMAELALRHSYRVRT